MRRKNSPGCKCCCKQYIYATICRSHGRTGFPRAGVTVTLRKTQTGPVVASAVTDSTGGVRFRVEPGLYYCSFSGGVVPVTYQITLQCHDTQTFDLVQDPINQPLTGFVHRCHEYSQVSPVDCGGLTAPAVCGPRLPGVKVTLFDDANRVVEIGHTDGDGLYALTIPHLGSYTLLFEGPFRYDTGFEIPFEVTDPCAPVGFEVWLGTEHEAGYVGYKPACDCCPDPVAETLYLSDANGIHPLHWGSYSQGEFASGTGWWGCYTFQSSDRLNCIGSSDCQAGNGDVAVAYVLSCEDDTVWSLTMYWQEVSRDDQVYSNCLVPRRLWVSDHCVSGTTYASPYPAVDYQAQPCLPPPGAIASQTRNFTGTDPCHGQSGLAISVGTFENTPADGMVYITE